MTSSNRNIFCVTGPLWLTGHLRRNDGWVNNREAGDLRLHRVDYDVIVMWSADISSLQLRMFSLSPFY